MTTTPEDQARQMLSRMGIANAHMWSAGELVELANLIAERDELRSKLDRLEDMAYRSRERE